MRSQFIKWLESIGGGNTMDFQKFLELHRESLYGLADDNTCKNNNGMIVVSTSDEWRNSNGNKYVKIEI
jgi:hypothetical protein